MNIVRVLAGNRRQFCISFLGLAALASGCGDNPSTPETPPQTGGKTPGELQAEARKKAFGPSGNAKTTKESSRPPAEAPKTP
jgi:hypothetical protein